MASVQPFPDSVMQQIIENSAHAFSHRLVMDAVDVSLALNRHLLIYAIDGAFQIETESASWRLPPTRAGWVPAGEFVKTTVVKPAQCISIFFKEDFLEEIPNACTIFNVTPLILEMFKYTLRWNETHPENSSLSDRFFLTLFDLCQEEMQSPSLFSLPKAKTKELATVLQYTLDHLSENLRLDELADVVAMSTRSLTRRFSSEIHMTWGQYLLQARMMRAMDHLIHGMTVTETALSVGFTNVGAFTTAFHKYTDTTPTQFQTQFR